MVNFIISGVYFTPDRFVELFLHVNVKINLSSTSKHRRQNLRSENALIVTDQLLIIYYLTSGREIITKSSTIQEESLHVQKQIMHWVDPQFF